MPPSELPSLREEISLYPGPHAADGSPTWTLHDPASNRFFRIGWREFEMLSRWDLHTPEAIAQAISAETTLRMTPRDVELFTQHLAQSHLFRPMTAEDRARFLEIQRHSQPHWVGWMLHNYLFMRIPLWRPDSFLRRTAPAIQWMFSREFLLLITMTAFLSLGLIVRQWEAFVTTFQYFFSWTGVIAYAGALFASKIIHELGHAYAAQRFGCRVPTMGVAFLVMYPVLYTETSDVWKLSSRRQRMVVGMAGMAAELMLAIIAALAWSFLPDGPLRSASFLLASAIWIITLAVNLNPMMRFDGYFLLCDALEIPNLQDRAFALGRWRLREWLFGLGVLPPEKLAPSRQKLLIALAFGIWIYRLFLFFGIALLVYHAFFKLLGIFLFLVEVGWFILRPLGREIMVWYKVRGVLHLNRNLVVTLLLFVASILLLVLPWHFSIAEAPATLQSDNHTVIYAPASAQVVQIQVRSGTEVAQGDLLLRFFDPDLQHRLDTVEKNIVMARLRLAVQGVDFSESGSASEPQKQDQAMEEEWVAALAERHALQTEMEKLSVFAPFSGMVVDLAEDVAVGDWVAAKEPILTVIDANRPIVKGYVSEGQFNRVAPEARGVFYPENADVAPLPGRLLRKDQTTTRTLNELYLASLYGGLLPVREDRAGKLVVEGAMYRVDFVLDQDIPVRSVMRGVMTLEAPPERPIVRLARTVHEVLVRESGF
ncbi:MAG: hemolysin D [Magnetococcales bacterium]|nr:hemolysin D [Magnetococcales bacterium]